MRLVVAGLLASTLALGGCSLFFPSAPAGVEAFQYQASRVPVGPVYHYSKSNIDGSTPTRVSLDISEETTPETVLVR